MRFIASLNGNELHIPLLRPGWSWNGKKIWRHEPSHAHVHEEYAETFDLLIWNYSTRVSSLAEAMSVVEETITAERKRQLDQVVDRLKYEAADAVLRAGLSKEMAIEIGSRFAEHVRLGHIDLGNASHSVARFVDMEVSTLRGYPSHYAAPTPVQAAMGAARQRELRRAALPGRPITMGGEVVGVAKYPAGVAEVRLNGRPLPASNVTFDPQPPITLHPAPRRPTPELHGTVNLDAESVEAFMKLTEKDWGPPPGGGDPRADLEAAMAYVMQSAKRKKP